MYNEEIELIKEAYHYALFFGDYSIAKERIGIDLTPYVDVRVVTCDKERMVSLVPFVLNVYEREVLHLIPKTPLDSTEHGRIHIHLRTEPHIGLETFREREIRVVETEHSSPSFHFHEFSDAHHTLWELNRPIPSELWRIERPHINYTILMLHRHWVQLIHHINLLVHNTLIFSVCQGNIDGAAHRNLVLQPFYHLLFCHFKIKTILYCIYLFGENDYFRITSKAASRAAD